MISIVHRTGWNEVVIPEAMGTPKEGQMVGTVLEQLGELRGRICYDSLGRGRDSAEYHKHIIESGHWNVYNGCVATILVKGKVSVWSFVNRPGVMVEQDVDGILVTMNAQAMLSWDERGALSGALRNVWAGLMPQVFERRGMVDSQVHCELAEEQIEWVSMYMKMNRGGSHEQVRHHFDCGVSQRSTRYVDESGAERVEHPLVREARDAGYELGEVVLASGERVRVRDVCNEAYKQAVKVLTGMGKDRKAARGAAREYLEHQLATELIFSASMAQWGRMIAARSSPFADGHIREVYDKVKELLG